MRSGRHEEIRKGPEVKIYIWEVVKRTPGSFGGIPGLYRGHRKGSGGPPGGATSSGGPYGLYGEGNQPKWAGAPHPPRAHVPRVEEKGRVLKGEGTSEVPWGGWTPPHP